MLRGVSWPRGLACVVLVGACGAGQTQPSTATDSELGALDQTDWTWASAVCDDGQHQLTARGFEDHLHITAIGGGMRMTHELGFATEGCAETVITWASADGAAFRFVDQARVADAVDRTCVNDWPRERSGEVLRRDDSLEVRVYRSALCGGYDIRHVYRAVSKPTTNDRARIRQHVAALVLRDPTAITRDYALQASLIVPKPGSQGGGSVRYEGRDAVRGWFSLLARSVSWIGARVLDISEVAPGRYVTRVEYIDDALQQPLLLVLTLQFADGEIYEAQWTLASELVPKANADVASGDAGADADVDADAAEANVEQTPPH